MARGHVALACAALAVAAGPVVGDEPPAELSPLVVTAQKTPQDEREVPIAVTVVNGERLERSRIDTTDDLQRFVPGASFDRSSLTLRGIGTVSPTVTAFDPSVAVFVDGVYFGRGTAAMTPLWDLEQVEVIRGPQGTLLGKNTIGGALSLTTAMPLDTWSTTVQGLVGGLGHGYKAVLNAPWTDDLALRLSFMRDLQDGYLFNTTQDAWQYGRELTGGRARLAWRPPGALSGWMGIEHGELERGGSHGSQLIAATDESLALFRAYDPATEANASDFRASTDAPRAGSARRGTGVTLNGIYELDWGTVTALGNTTRSDYALDADADFTPAPLITQSVGEDASQWSQELRLNGHWLSLDYIVGVYYLEADTGIDIRIVGLPEGGDALAAGALAAPEATADLLAQLGGGPDIGTYGRDESIKDFSQSGRTISLFGQATWEFMPRWSLITGLRWTTERKDVRAVNRFAGSGAYFQVFLDEAEYDERRRRDEDDYAPKLALLFRWTDDVSLYASAARGMKGGGFNAFAPQPDRLEYDGEHSTTVELGCKAWMIGNRLAVNTSVFSTDYEDLQVQNFNGTHYVIQNAAQARIEGLEVQSRWLLREGWRLLFTGAYLDARYTHYPDAPAPSGSESSTQDLTGEPMMNAPRWSLHGGIEYESAPFVSGLVWRAGLDAFHRSRASLNLDNDPIDSQPAHSQLDASVGLVALEQDVVLSLAGHNLTDEVILVEAADVFFFAGDHWGRVKPGRTWSAAVKWEWQ